MSKKKPHEYAQDVLGADDYLKEILGKIDEDKREAVLGRLGERIMAKDDYSRGMDELRTKDQLVLAYKGELDSWYSEKLENLQIGAKARQELEGLKKNNSVPADGSSQLQSLEGYVKKEDVEQILAARIAHSEGQGLAAMAQLGTLVGRHQHLFGEPLDLPALVAHAKSKGMNAEAAWQDLTTEKRQALEEKKQKADRERLKADLRAELQKEMGHGVYPVGAEESTSPTLAALGFKKKEGDAPSYGVQASVDEYYRMQKPPSA